MHMRMLLHVVVQQFRAGMKLHGVQGGGVYIKDGTANFDGCDIHGNEAGVSAR